MNRVWLIGSALAYFGAFLSWGTGQGFGAVAILTVIASILLVIGLAGKP